MVGAYNPCAVFIRLAKQSALDAIFLNVSFVGAKALAEKLGGQGDGVIITQVVPHFDSDLPIVSEYRKALKAWNPSIQRAFGSLEGYIAARILWRALETIQGPLTKEGVVNALEGLGEFDMRLGQRLHLGPKEHQACHRVWPTILRGGKAVPFQWEELGTRVGGR
jgi:branched-chain amino acid transport system substrate-binding protein